MHSIKNYFAPTQQKNTDVDKLKPSKKSASLLKVTDHEVEDITGILYEVHRNSEEDINTSEGSEKKEDVVDEDAVVANISLIALDENGEMDDSAGDGKVVDNSVVDNSVVDKSVVDKTVVDNRTVEGNSAVENSEVGNSAVNNPAEECSSLVQPDIMSNGTSPTSPKPERTRRFSFTITSPTRTKKTLQVPALKSSNDPFAEGCKITAVNVWAKEFSACDDDLIHPKKRFKSVSSASGSDIANDYASPKKLPLKLVARKLVIPCLQPASSFAEPPKNKEFYNLRHSLSSSRRKNYVIMSRGSNKTSPLYYEIDRILTHKITSSQGEKKFQFLVKWTGFSDKYTSWEPEDHFDCSPHVLLLYITKLYAAVTRNSAILDDLKAIKFKMKKLQLKITSVKSQIYLWQLDSELSTQAFKVQYRRLLKQYTAKVKEELGPSFPTVEIQNTVDFNLPPLNFTFVRDRFAGKGVHISDDTLIGCVCSGEYGTRDCCLQPDKECCPHLGGAQPPYNNKSRLVLKPGSPVYECNARCSCGPHCGNRIVQRGTQVNTAIYKTPDKGWGLKTLQNIPKGTFVVEYVGEVITWDEAELRGKEYDAQGLTYLFDLDYQTTEGADVDDGMFTIDAAFYGNTSHFINHSCDPNLAVFSCWVSNLDIRLPHICLFAIKTITAGDELTFNYQIDRIVEEDNRAAQRLSVECRCGTKKCVRYLHG